MSTIDTLTVYPRTDIGKSSTRLGRAGRIPAVLYGMSRDAVSISLDRHEFEQFMSHHAAGSTLVEIQIEGEKKPVNVMIREMQMAPVKGNIVHVDFMAVSLDIPVHAVVAVHLIGDASGVKLGGILTTERHELNVEAKPAEIPNFLEVDVSALEIGDSIHVGDVAAPKGVTLLDDADSVIASVIPPAAEEEVVEGAEQAEPEVIGAKAEEE